MEDSRSVQGFQLLKGGGGGGLEMCTFLIIPLNVYGGYGPDIYIYIYIYIYI